MARIWTYWRHSSDCYRAEKKQARVTYAYRTVVRLGAPIKIRQDVQTSVEWIHEQQLVAPTQPTILSAIRSIQPKNKALQQAQVKVPHRLAQEEVLSKEAIQRVLKDLRTNEEWFYPCFLLWMSTGLRDSGLTGLTWDAVRLEEGKLLISKTLKRDDTATHKEGLRWQQDR